VISSDTRSAISSLASGDGPTPSGSPDGQLSLFGPGAAHASPTVSPDDKPEMQTPGICGHSSGDSSPHENLQSLLVSRLRKNLAGRGSPLFALTWRSWDMPSGAPLSALLASAHRNPDSARSSWPTPLAHEARLGFQDRSTGKKGTQESLSTVAVLNYAPESDPRIQSVLGSRPSGYRVASVNLAQLDPAFTLWLMGYPAVWARCAARVMPSSRSSRRRL